MVVASPPFATLLLRPITCRGHYPGGNFCKTKERGRKEEGRKGGKRVAERGRVIVNSRAGSDGYRSVG